jgi:hypothetical protein
MVANMRYLKQMSPLVQYTAYGVNKQDGMKIASGIVAFPAHPGRTMTKDISFGSFFTPGIHPSIQATVAAIDQQRTFVAIQGIGAGNLRPMSEQGFRVVLNADPLKDGTNYFPTVVHVHWLAIGY